MTTPPPPSPAVPQDCGTIIDITSSSDPEVFPEVFPEDIARTCFRCQFGSPPTSDPITTWMLNGSVISPSQGVVVDGVLVVFDPVEAIGISAPVPIVCVSSAAENLTISAQALGKLHALCKIYIQQLISIYMQQLISFMCEWRGFTCGLSLCMYTSLIPRLSLQSHSQAFTPVSFPGFHPSLIPRLSLQSHSQAFTPAHS